MMSRFTFLISLSTPRKPAGSQVLYRLCICIDVLQTFNLQLRDSASSSLISLRSATRAQLCSYLSLQKFVTAITQLLRMAAALLDLITESKLKSSLATSSRTLSRAESGISIKDKVLSLSMKSSGEAIIFWIS
eukprot:gnl/TRDRNA2_/TRDRNA2_67045_c0_seq1.p1 gnl/TRDRNA2_/TRDRNA2_67045_c0~~gnl/TRDRNA2_/TRDRNA2_67045_c0_seq1.p1  ORF type:complete len:133 (-),score=6.76 gnl/TRDRNA2_/TRDRNA2_67045_c0_seq1:47-445(-)